MEATLKCHTNIGLASVNVHLTVIAVLVPRVSGARVPLCTATGWPRHSWASRHWQFHARALCRLYRYRMFVVFDLAMIARIETELFA